MTTVIRDGNGNPIPNAQYFVYLKGTSNPATVYSDLEKMIEHMRPIVCDSNGVLPNIYLKAGEYHCKIKDAKSALVYPKWPHTHKDATFII